MGTLNYIQIHLPDCPVRTPNENEINGMHAAALKQVPVSYLVNYIDQKIGHMCKC